MVRQFIDSGADGAEWSVGHMPLGFRICTYNHAHKPTPVHVHDRSNARVLDLPAMSKAQGQRIVRSYASRHDWFDVELLELLVKEELHGTED